MITALSLILAGASSNGRTRVFGALNLGSNPSFRVKIGEAVLRKVQLFIHYMNCIYDFF